MKSRCQWHDHPSDVVGSGRALLTGFAGVGAAGCRRPEQARCAGTARLRFTAPYFHSNSADTLEDVVDHYIEFFKRVRVNAVALGVVPPAASTDGVNLTRERPEERAAPLAYLRKEL
jgi:hypothetical protein